MKKNFNILLTGISLALLLTACLPAQKTPTQNASTKDISTSNTLEFDSISDTEYANMFQSRYYKSIEELYQELRDIPEEELEYIKNKEDHYIEDTRSKTLITEDELKNGIFGNLRETILSDDIIMIPYYQDSAVPLNEKSEYCIELVETRACRKPWIAYIGDGETTGVSVHMMYYDPTLVNDANKKGASWLKSVIDPDGLNVYNYETVKKEAAGEMYEVLIN